MASDRQVDAGAVYVLATLDTKGHEAAYVRDLLVGLGVRVQARGRRLPGRTGRAGRRRSRGAFRGRRFRRRGIGRRCRSRSGRQRGGRKRRQSGWPASIGHVESRGRARAGRFGRHHDRHRRHARVAARRAQAHGQHLGFRAGAALRGRQRYPDAQLGRRYLGPESHHAARAGRGGPRDGRHGALATGATRQRGPAADCGHDVRRDDCPASSRPRLVLEQAGYEVLVFHATGSGGQAMESLIARA